MATEDGENTSFAPLLVWGTQMSLCSATHPVPSYLLPISCVALGVSAWCCPPGWGFLGTREGERLCILRGTLCGPLPG